MRAPLPRSWSIGKRLTFLYTLIICIILVVSGLLLDWVLRSDLKEEDKRFLATEMQSLRILLREYPDDVKAWKAEIEREALASVSTFAKYYVRIIDEDGKTIVETPGMPDNAEHLLSRKPEATPFLAIEYATFTAQDGRPFLFALAMAKEYRHGEKERIIQIALEMSHEGAIISDYRQKVALVVIGGVILSLLLGFLITKEGLKPLRELMHDVRDITPDKLQVRVGFREWPQEIVALANVFDRMLDRLEASFTSISQFSADLAHELRTPINNLRGEAEVAISKARTLEEYRQVLMSSLEEYERLSRMIENILFLARSDSKKQKISVSPLNMLQEITEVLEYYEAVREEKEISVTLSVKGTVNADKTLFRRAMANVLSNAFQYTPTGGSISVQSRLVSDVEDRTSKSDETKKEGLHHSAIEIIVTDTGIGIGPEDIPRVFDRFYRAAKARSVYSQGTGLGFSIVKSIMELHNGNVKVTSGLASGTIVTLTFPASLFDEGRCHTEKYMYSD
ncbi:MAG: Sensor kinase CusS [Syntrophorhabdus sp. PtaB.Bin006]|nr:MAG: Sensor kinase CusS [Syntrophorhabdus sp. PtaB.Bin006]